MTTVLWILLGFAVLGFVASLSIEGGYTARAQKVQIVQITGSNGLGPITVDVGEPAMLILDDQKGLLKNLTPTGFPMLDANYVKLHGASIIRLETITSMAGLARIGCIVSSVLAIIGLALMKRIHSILMPPEPD